MSRHEKERAPVLEHDPQRLRWSRTEIRFGLSDRFLACQFTRFSRSFLASFFSQSCKRLGAWSVCPFMKMAGESPLSPTETILCPRPAF